jgi:cell division protein FtsZ
MAGGQARDIEHRPRIVVFGVGGAGGNAVNNMVAASLDGVEFVVANTDAQALARARSEHRLQLGLSITEGLGAGARPDVGKRAAEDSLAEIAQRVAGAHMVFVTAGMGGGTGTGAAPVIARAARDARALVVGVVTKPFDFEGGKRMRVAEEGIRELEREVDTLIVIPNQNLFRIATEKTSIAEAFALADAVLHSGVRGVTDLMTRPGLVNLDFADVRTVMSEMGKAVMGSGEAEGPRRAQDAVQAAISNPLLDDATLRGAKAALINVSGGPGLTLYEIDEAASAIRAEIDPDANIIVGSAIDEILGARVRVSVVATGIPAGAANARNRRAASGSAAAPAPLAAPGAPEAAGGFTFEPPIREARPRAFTPERKPEERPEIRVAAPKVEAPKSEIAGLEPPADDERPGAEDAFGIISALSARRRAEAAAPPVEPADSEEERAGKAGGFSLFGRRRRTEAGDETPAPVNIPREESAGDEQDLEIPAFLRRQAN